MHAQNEAGTCEDSQWVDLIAQDAPLLAIKIGVEAALRYEVDNDIVVWGADLLDCCAAGGPFSLGPRRK